MLQINLKHFLCFLSCAIYKSRNTLKIVQKEIFPHPKAILVAEELMMAVVVLARQKQLFLALKTLPE
jgi:hypothetical protein